MAPRYEAAGLQAEFEPGSRGRVLRNLLGIQRVREMERAESEALVATQFSLLDQFSFSHRFTVADLHSIHRQWLGGIYSWAGEYRSVNVSKGGFMFAAAAQVPRLMEAFERNELAKYTPCEGMEIPRLIEALAHTHGELILIHPFREGNGRCARVLAYLMAIQAGLPSLDFTPLAGRGKRAYVAAIQAVMDSDFGPLEDLFGRVVRRSLASFGEAA